MDIETEVRRRRKDELVRIAKIKGEKMGREGSVYSRSILHFAIPIPCCNATLSRLRRTVEAFSSRSTRFVALTSPSDRD